MDENIVVSGHPCPETRRSQPTTTARPHLVREHFHVLPELGFQNCRLLHCDVISREGVEARPYGVPENCYQMKYVGVGSHADPS